MTRRLGQELGFVDEQSIIKHQLERTCRPSPYHVFQQRPKTLVLFDRYDLDANLQQGAREAPWTWPDLDDLVARRKFGQAGDLRVMLRSRRKCWPKAFLAKRPCSERLWRRDGRSWRLTRLWPAPADRRGGSRRSGCRGGQAH